MQQPSSELLKQAFAFDRKAQLELYKQSYPILIAVARRFRKNEDDHLALVNNAFIKIIQNLNNFQEVNYFSWVKRIITNEIIDDYRRNKKYRNLFNQDLDVELNQFTHAEAEFEINNSHLNSMVEKLPESTKVVFNLFAIDGFSHKEIGEMLGISEQTSKWHTKMARKKLKEQLKIEVNHEAR
jgi:RNA polymerase sigma-70 factor (ECF subfamily)